MSNTAELNSQLRKPGTDEPGDWIRYWRKAGQPWRREPEIGEMRQEYLFGRLVNSATREAVERPYLGMRLNRGDIEWILAVRMTKADAPPNIMDLRGAVLSHVSATEIKAMVRAQRYELCARHSIDQSENERIDKDVPQTAKRLLEAYGRGTREFLGWNLEGANLKGADLRGIQLSGSKLRKANMESANLTGAELSRCDLTEACMQRADLTNAIILDATLTRSNFHAARLVGANLGRSVATSANLSGADMTRAQLQHTDFSDASLEFTCLSASCITGAKLEGANLEGATLPTGHEEDEQIVYRDRRGPSIAETYGWVQDFQMRIS